MVDSLLSVIYTVFKSFGSFLLQIAITVGTVPKLCVTRALWLVEQVIPRKISMLFRSPSANFPALFQEFQATYTALRKQCIEESSLLDNIMDFETAAAHLAEVVSESTVLVENVKMAKLLHNIQAGYHKLRRVLKDYHSEVDLRYCQAMYHGDGALLSLRSTVGTSEALILEDTSVENLETHKALNRTFKFLLEFHRSSVTAISGMRGECWTALHALNRDIAALQCLVAEKNPALHRNYGVDILVNLWDSLGQYTEFADIADEISASLSVIVLERERTAAHILAAKPVLDNAGSCIDDLWKETAGSGDRDAMFYEEQLASIARGVQVMRETRDSKNVEASSVAQQEHSNSLSPLPAEESLSGQVRSIQPVGRVVSGSSLRRHYSVM